MPIEYSQLRALVLQYLRQVPVGQLNFVDKCTGVLAFCQKRVSSPDDADVETMQRIFHELYLEHVIITGTGPRSIGSGAMCWPFYRLTEYGRKVVERGQYVPYDPDGYLSRIKGEISGLDGTVLRYLQEALACFRLDFLLAAAVMTGCAAEKALLLLVDAYGAAITDSAKKGKYEKDTRSWLITQKYRALWKRLEPLIPSLPRELGGDLHVILDRVFDLIRTTRNEAGHPTAEPIERETVHANLILFPSYCRRVYGLITHFQQCPAT